MGSLEGIRGNGARNQPVGSFPELAGLACGEGGIQVVGDAVATKPDSIDDIIKGIRDSNCALATESRLAGAGLKEEQDIASVMDRFAWLYNLDTVRQAEDAYRSENDPEGRERLRRVYYHLLDGYLERQTAEREDAIASFEIGAIVEVGGKTIPYYD